MPAMCLIYFRFNDGGDPEVQSRRAIYTVDVPHIFQDQYSQNLYSVGKIKPYALLTWRCLPNYTNFLLVCSPLLDHGFSATIW